MKKLKTLFATALLSTATSTLVYANNPKQQFQQGLEAAQKGDFKTAFELWKPLAEQGYASAQHNLGQMYYNGQAVKQDYQQAAKWFEKAAEQGHVKAQTILGILYALGQGIQQDMSKAKMWLDKACDNGDQGACDIYGYLNKSE